MTTVGMTLARWRSAHPVTDTAFALRIGRFSIPLPDPGQLAWHDLHHALLGYDTTLVGEMEVSAFELRTRPRTFMVLCLCIAGVLAGLVCAPRRTWAAWKRAHGWRNLYGGDLDYATTLARPADELRAWMHTRTDRYEKSERVQKAARVQS